MYRLSAPLTDKSKKRKLAEATAKTAPPAKKVLMSAAVPVKVKKEKVVAAKDAKVDSSFFSTPKPKQKLPSFKKAPSSTASGTSTVISTAADVAQPSAVNPFQEALASMSKGRTGAGSSATPEPGLGGAAAGTASSSGAVKVTTKRKSVTWAPEGQLEKVRIIEKAVYDDDPVQVCIASYVAWKIASHGFTIRVRTAPIAFVSSSVRKVPQCTSRYLRNQLTGMNLIVSAAHCYHCVRYHRSNITP